MSRDGRDADAERVFHVRPDIADRAVVNARQFQLMTNHAAQRPDDYWAEQAGRIVWRDRPTVADQSDFTGEVAIAWFADGTLNVTESCLDRHAAADPERVALIWESDDETLPPERITYGALLARVCRLANALTRLGVGRGDRVGLYMPMIPEAVVAMLAIARIGAVHAVMFAGFSPQSVAKRLADCGAVLLITADELRRAGRIVPLKANADAALADTPSVRHAIVVAATGRDVPMTAGRDLDYATLVAAEADECPPAVMAAEDPLFILYTSGSTGAPKGLLHTCGGYLVWASYTHEIVFDHRPGEVFWCTADIGWITGHSYLVYGPLANGATVLVFEGVPTHPDPGRWWRIVDRHQVATFYTAPTAIRALMRHGEDPVRRASRSSLRILGSVGEPINPEAWLWFHDVVGDERCPIVNTWWQTETGGIMISPLPGATPLRPGWATLPLPGVSPALLDAKGAVVDGEGDGQLVLTRSWPGLARTIHGDHERFRNTYFAPNPGYYTSGDGARRSASGDYWITGRVDDVLNVSGHRIGTAEVESALAADHDVVEAAVVGVPHEVKGEALYAYVVLRDGVTGDEALHRRLTATVRGAIGGYATPDHLHWAPDLPKTRSGKIMRRILRKIASGDVGELGDTSTLADPSVVQVLVDTREA